jgi:hypothetical protein
VLGIKEARAIFQSPGGLQFIQKENDTEARK